MTAVRQPNAEAVRDLHERLRAEAALRDGFRPAEILEAIGAGLPEDNLVIAAALSALREECTVSRDEAGQSWTMRPAVRRRVLATIPSERVQAADSAVAQALAGMRGYQPAAIRRLLRYAEQGDPPPAQVFARRLRTLERAGPGAPAHRFVAGLRSALNAAEQAETTDRLLSRGVFGRDAELSRIRDWIGKPQRDPPLRCLHVSGLPGMGKSYLLQAAVRDARRGEGGALVVWLDFDRSGLSVSDATAFFEEISRQIGDALPSHAAWLRDIRLKAARARGSLSEREASYALPRELLAAMGKIIASQARPVLIVLDTLEVLRARGETAVMRLFDHLDALMQEDFAPLAVISAGRGDALDPVPERSGASIALRGLPDGAAEAFLEAQRVPPVSRGAIMAMAGGNPLLLKLGARAHEQGLTLGKSPEGEPEATGAYLYRAILSRLEPPLNDLAQAGLVLLRMQSSHLSSILAPALDLNLEPARAETLFEELATQHWLVESDTRGGWLRHRSDIRAAFLPLLYRDQAALVRRVNELAAAVFGDTDPPAALYHQLQLTRDGRALPPIGPVAAAGFSAAMIEELPPMARDALHGARGERSGFFRAGSAQPSGDEGDAGRISRFVDRGAAMGFAAAAESRPPVAFAFDHRSGRLTTRLDRPPRALDQRLVRDLRLMLAEGEREEGAYLVQKALATPFLADDPGALVVLAYLWLSGAWASALRLWRAAGTPGDDDDPTLARILREIDAEARFVTAARRLPALPPPPASGRSALLGGAYDLALATRVQSLEKEPSAAEGRARATALLAPWLAGIDDGASAKLRAEAALRRERGGVLVAPGLPDTLRPGLEIAPLVPHLTPLTALASDRTGAQRAKWLRGLAERLPEILRLQAPWIELDPDTIKRTVDTPFDMLDLLASCGLLSEAATAMALELRDPELARLAVSLERWRRLSHGDWSLSARPPDGWHGAARFDAASEHLLDELVTGTLAAGVLLTLWLPGETGQRALVRRLRSSEGEGGLEERAAYAIRRNLPPGLALPAAVPGNSEFW